MSRPFNSELILEEKISDATLKAYHVGFDQNAFRLQPLVDLICDVIPEYALGYYQGTSVLLPEIRRRMVEAANRVYKTPKFKNRGEFGELVLHLLLRDFHNTIPLVSKIWFKDAHNLTVHGFDGVHISISKDTAVKKLWLGESKIYQTGSEGIKSLSEDLKNHLTEDYLRSEFELISPKLHQDVPEIEYWRNLLHKNQKLDMIFQSICIPMVCAYSSPLFNKHTGETKEYIADFISECKSLEGEFNGLKISTNLEVILMLLPIPSKKELVEEIHKKLEHMRSL